MRETSRLVCPRTGYNQCRSAVQVALHDFYHVPILKRRSALCQFSFYLEERERGANALRRQEVGR